MPKAARLCLVVPFFRTCSHSLKKADLRSNFFDNKEKIRRRTVCTSRIFDAVSGKIAAKTPLSGYENKFSLIK